MKRIRVIGFIWAAVAGLFICGFSGQDPPRLSRPESLQSKSTTALQEDVDSLLATRGTLKIRRRIKEVFALIDRLVEAERQDEAFRYLDVALKHNSWALDYQLLYAEMLRARGQKWLASESAKLVLQYGEKDEQVNRARKLLDQEPLPELPDMVRIAARKPTLVLVPIGPVDICVLEGVKDRFSKKIGIPVLLADAYVIVPPLKRDPDKLFLSELRKRIRNRISTDVRFSSFLRKNGISFEDLERDSAVEKAGRLFVKVAGGDNAVAQFDSKMDRLKKAASQWDIDDLMNSLHAAVRPFSQRNVYFMGITSLDAFADRGNFVFGTALFRGPLSVITYRRFTADFFGFTPDRKRLIERTFKQALSSFGFMIGVPRCSSPTCARAYPHNLPEHDAKSPNLCKDCRAAFEVLLGVHIESEGQPDTSISLDRDNDASSINAEVVPERDTDSLKKE